MSDKTLDQLDAQIATVRTKLDAQIRDLVEVIVNDIPTFAQKNVRRAFIESVDQVEEKSDDEIADMKRKLSEFSSELVKKYRTLLLDNLDAWIGPDVPLDTGKTLDANPAISQTLRTIATDVEAFIVELGITPLDIVYKTPAYFINGKYAPGMIEKYWAALADLRALEAEHAAAVRDAQKARMAQRWDEN